MAYERAAAHAQVTRGARLLDLPVAARTATGRGVFQLCNIKDFFGAAGVCVLAERGEGEGGQAPAVAASAAALRRPLSVRWSKRPSPPMGGGRAVSARRSLRRLAVARGSGRDVSLSGGCGRAAAGAAMTAHSFALPLVLFSAFWGLVGIAAPWFVPKGPNRG